MTHRKILAVVLWMSGALLAFSATAIAVRALAPSFTVFEILAMRNAAGLAILLAIAALKPALRRELRPRRMGLHLARNSMHFAATYAWTLGVTLLPLATVFALEFTAPAWVTLLAVLFLGEAATGGRVVAVTAGFLGVIVIVRPGLAVLEPASLVVLGAALGFAGTAIVTKILTRTESVFAILTWMSAMQLVPNLIGSDPAFWSKADATHFVPILAICVSGLLSHYCLTHAYRIGDASMVVPLDFLRIPLIALVGWWLYAEPLDPFVLLGSALIVAGILWNLRAEAAGVRA